MTKADDIDERAHRLNIAGEPWNDPRHPDNLPSGGDGDPSFPGGIGCEFDNTLWATAESAARHMREAHGIDEDRGEGPDAYPPVLRDASGKAVDVG